jgi:hypothetical protein
LDFSFDKSERVLFIKMGLKKYVVSSKNAKSTSTQSSGLNSGLKSGLNASIRRPKATKVVSELC